MSGASVDQAADIRDEAERRGAAGTAGGTGDAAGGRADPRWSRVAWLAVAGFATFAVVAAAGVPISGLLGKQTRTTGWSANHPIDGVELSVDSADLTVRPSSGATAEALRQTLTWSLTKPQVTESWRGQTLVISEHCSSRRLFEGDECGAALDLAVPASVPVRVTADSGSVTVQRMAGNVRVDVVSGDIALDAVSGDLWARAESGSIDADRLRSLHMDAQTVSGDMTLGFAAAPDAVSASAVSGSVNVTVPPGTTYRVAGRTVSGDRQITAGLSDNASPRSITLDSESGDADLGYAAAQ